jgi:hypothetical protein
MPQQEEEGKSWNPKKTQGVDGGAVNAVRTTGSGQRVGGVCGEGWEYVWKSQRTRCVQCVGRQARAQECQQKEEEGEKRNPTKKQGVDGEVSMPYAPPGADSVLEASVERGGNMVLYICNTFYNFNGRPSM